METSDKSEPSHLDVDEKDKASTSSPLRALPSPKTPVRSTFYSDDDDESDEMESPNFPHLIPVYRRTPDEYDLGGVRIGWDDGFGSPSLQDDDLVNDKKSRRKKNRLFSERRHRSFLRSNPFHSTADSPPKNCESPNHAAIQEELNNYLECILNCLSAKKRNRQLLKAQMEANSSANSSTENNNVTENNSVGCLLDDSADDEMMMLCSQAIEQKIAADASYSTINKPTKIIASDSLSINGISPLKETKNSTNNNVYYHASKKFKPVQSRLFGEEQKDNYCKPKCHTVTSSTAKKSENNNSSSVTTSVINCKKDDSSSSFLDTFSNDDDFFLSIDFLEIEKQILADVKKTTTVSVTQNNYKQPNKNVNKQLENKPALSNHASTSNSSPNSVLWRRSTSTSSIVNKQQQPKQFSSVIGTKNNSVNGGNAKATTSTTTTTTTTTSTTTRYCTPAEIEAKRERARRTLLLKFKSKNRSVS